MSTNATGFGSEAVVSCPRGYEFVAGQGPSFKLQCLLGGHWSQNRIPSCQRKSLKSSPADQRFLNPLSNFSKVLFASASNSQRIRRFGDERDVQWSCQVSVLSGVQFCERKTQRRNILSRRWPMDRAANLQRYRIVAVIRS